MTTKYLVIEWHKNPMNFWVWEEYDYFKTFTDGEIIQEFNTQEEAREFQRILQALIGNKYQ